MYMKKIKIGYLPMYPKLYDDGNPRRRDPLVNYMNMLIGMLESQGFEVVCADEVCRLKEEFERAAAKFNADDEIVAVVTQHLAYSPSLMAIDALMSLKAPIVVFDTTPDYELVSAAVYAERTFPNHGIHGVQEMCSMLKRRGRDYKIVAGHALHGDVVNRLCGILRGAAAAKAFRNVRVGLAGGEFEGMGDFIVKDEVYKQVLGGRVFRLGHDEAQRYEANVTEEEIDAEIKADARKYTVQVDGVNEYRAATRTGLGIRKWMEDNGLNALSVNFLHTYENGLSKMPFVECCKVMERGQGYAGEGDTLTAGLVAALISVFPDTSFVEMFCPDWEKDLVLLSHMGEMNTKLSQWKGVITDSNFVYNESGNTVKMSGCFKPGKAVLVNLTPANVETTEFDLIICPCEMTGDGLEEGAYKGEIQVWLKPGMPVDEFLTKYSEAGGTHHSALVYNANPAEIQAFGRFMGFKTVII